MQRTAFTLSSFPARTALRAALATLALTLSVGCAAVDTANKWGSDAWVTSKVKAAICSDRGASACAAINVETASGVVQLSGFANNQAEINGAVESARKTPGVRSVRNDIRLKPR